MAAFANLVVSIERGLSGESYDLDMVFAMAGDETDSYPLGADRVVVSFDADALLALRANPQAYGRALAEALGPRVTTIIREKYALATAANQYLRVRLDLSPACAELHGLFWETMRDENDQLLFAGDRICFSRYLRSTENSRAARSQAETAMKALVVIANPGGLDRFQLAALDVAMERAMAQESLAQVGVGEEDIHWLASGGTATLDRITDELRKGYDILYMVCHGRVMRDGTHLALEDEEGQVSLVSGRKLYDAFCDLWKLPRLAVLLTCQSAGKGGGALSDKPLAPLGPLLGTAGVPVVLAMQGDLSMDTGRVLVPTFFQELKKDGHVDRALAVARGAIRDRADVHVPVLFLRLREGKLWYKPTFDGDNDEERIWTGLVRKVERGKCLPIIGPHLAGNLFGARSAMSKRWAKSSNFPLGDGLSGELARVAQFLAVKHDIDYVHDLFFEDLAQQLKQRYGHLEEVLPSNLWEKRLTDSGLIKMISRVGAHCRETATDPYRVLASLEQPIYLSADPSGLLEEAMQAHNPSCAPRSEIFRWHQDLEDLPSIDEDPDYEPDEEEPLVFRLFGQLDTRESLVLTEDDYFDVLSGFAENQGALIPSRIQRMMLDKAMLFLGFRITDWDFRILFRGIMRQQASRLLRKHRHVAVQVDPELYDSASPEKIRTYLRDYTSRGDFEKFTIYFGSARDFLAELSRQMEV